MQRVEDVLMVVVAARVAGNDAALAQDVDPERVGFEHQLLFSQVGRDGIAVGDKAHLAVSVQGDGVSHAAVEVADG